MPVTIYADATGGRILDIEADHEPTARAVISVQSSPKAFTVEGLRVTVLDLIDAGLIDADESVEFLRPRLGEQYSAVILADGTFRLPDGSLHQSPSLAATRTADLVSYDGWYAWRVPRLGGTKLHELRQQLIATPTPSDVAEERRESEP